MFLKHIFQLQCWMVFVCCLLDLSISAAYSQTINTIQYTPADSMTDVDTTASESVLPTGNDDSVLNRCWTPTQLQSTAKERVIHLQKPADHSSPQRSSDVDLDNTQNRAFSTSIAARSIRSVIPAHGEKIIALTFDLCEQADEIAGYDGAIVDLLRAEKVNATFYAGGKWMRSHPERTLQLMADPLFEVGNHAWTHGNLRVLRGVELTAQILWPQIQYQQLKEQLNTRSCAASIPDSIPDQPTTFRFPYGTCDAVALQEVAAAGLYPVQWDIVTGDPSKKQTAQHIIDTVLKQIHPGAIIIAHGNGRGWHTHEALKTLIPALKKQGYQFVTVTTLLQSGKHVTAANCYETKPNDNLRYDKLFGRGTE